MYTIRHPLALYAPLRPLATAGLIMVKATK